MAYTEEQKRSHIRELQRCLHSLSHVHDLPRISADGFYDSQTADAVRAFQKQNHLPSTGETDSETWNAIAAAYRADVEMADMPVSIFPPGIRSYTVGATGTPVFMIQAILRAIRAFYPKVPFIHVDGSYGTETQKAVEWFQRVTNLPPSGNVDIATWNRFVSAAGITPQ